MSEHSVILRIPLEGGEFGSDSEREAIFDLDEKFCEVPLPEGGEYDGNGFGGSVAEFFFYGRDADALLAAVLAFCESDPLPTDTRALKRFGPADDPASRVEEVVF